VFTEKILRLKGVEAMRQMWFSGFLILLLGVGYIGWLALKSSTGVPHLTLMSSGTSAGG